MNARFWLRAAMVGMIVALLLISCAPAPTEAPVVEEPVAEEPAEEVAEEPAVEVAEEPAEEPAAPEKKTITIWTDPPGGGEAATCFSESVVDPFNEQSETIFVDVVYQPEAWDAIRTALAGGAGPDIVDTPGPSFVYELVQAGQLMALDDFS